MTRLLGHHFCFYYIIESTVPGVALHSQSVVMRTRAEVPAAVPAISHRRPRDSCVGICQVVAVGFLLFLNCNNAPVQGLMTSTEGCVIGNMAAGESLRNADGTRRPIVSFMSAMNLNKRVRWMPSSSKGRHLGWCPGCARAPGSSSCLSANNEGTVSEPLVFAQDALDDAWRSQRRIDWDAQNGRSGTLGERLMTVLGRGRPSAMFVENRSFMDSTLDNVVRVRVGYMAKETEIMKLNHGTPGKLQTYFVRRGSVRNLKIMSLCCSVHIFPMHLSLDFLATLCVDP